MSGSCGFVARGVLECGARLGVADTARRKEPKQSCGAEERPNWAKLRKQSQGDAGQALQAPGTAARDKGFQASARVFGCELGERPTPRAPGQSLHRQLTGRVPNWKRGDFTLKEHHQYLQAVSTSPLYRRYRFLCAKTTTIVRHVTAKTIRNEWATDGAKIFKSIVFRQRLLGKRSFQHRGAGKQRLPAIVATLSLRGNDGVLRKKEISNRR